MSYGEEVKIIILAGTFLMLIVFVFIFLFIIIYERKRIAYRTKLHEIEIENSRKMLEAVITTQENEKEQFAAELHDSLSQMLTSVIMMVNNIKDHVQHKPELADNYLNKSLTGLSSVAQQSLQEARAISRKLMPIILNDFGLNEAIIDIVTKINETSKTELKFLSTIQENRYPNDIERALFRITQELLNNTLKYAQATQVIINLSEEENNLILTYSDNGIGFNMPERKGKGLGLLSIESRVSAVQGAICMNSELGKGFSVEIKTPITPQNHDNKN